MVILMFCININFFFVYTMSLVIEEFRDFSNTIGTYEDYVAKYKADCHRARCLQQVAQNQIQQDRLGENISGPRGVAYSHRLRAEEEATSITELEKRIRQKVGQKSLKVMRNRINCHFKILVREVNLHNALCADIEDFAPITVDEVFESVKKLPKKTIKEIYWKNMEQVRSVIFF